jgi:chromosome segregation ATPase
MWSNRPVQRIDETYYEAWGDVESYILWVDASMRTVDRVNASLQSADRSADQMQREIAQLNQEVTSAESAETDADAKNPWTPVADAILAGR